MGYKEEVRFKKKEIRKIKTGTERSLPTATLAYFAKPFDRESLGEKYAWKQ